MIFGEKKIHHGWQEHELFKKTHPELSLGQMFGQYQYIYRHQRGKISLIFLPEYLWNRNVWEIYQLEGREQLFEDFDRFNTKEEAEIQIRKYFRDRQIQWKKKRTSIRERGMLMERLM